jgi:LysM repeat protein
MIRSIPLLLFLAFSAGIKAQQNQSYLEYIDKYKKLAIREMERAGVPASIKIAQAILESNAGNSELAQRANNHFGIKCGGDWAGKTYHKEDDDYDAFGNLQQSCFRKFKDVEDSYVAHSEFLRNPRNANRYGFLFQLDPYDYKRWARGLRAAGYATSQTYDEKLIRIIETYRLHDLDPLAGNQILDPAEDFIAGLPVLRINDAKVVVADGKLTPQDIAARTRISLRRLYRYNEKLPSSEVTLQQGYRVYLQPKRAMFRGKRKWHYLNAGETLFDVSQQYGVKLSKLYRRNRMPERSEPQANQRIKLKGCRVSAADRPLLLSEAATSPAAMANPDRDAPKPTAPEADENPGSEEAAPVYHTVAQGDTLYGIARRYGTTVANIKQQNKLSSDTIRIGQLLRIK